jgi:hypothetical protein
VTPSTSPGKPTTLPTVSAAPDPAALAQAAALRKLLTDSADDKRAIAAAAAQLNGCAHLKRAVQAFADAAHSRSVLVTRANALQIGLLPGGGQAVASLTRALRASARADQAYVDWGRSLHRGHGKHHRCRGDDALRARATRLSSESHAPKQATADAWNVIAASVAPEGNPSPAGPSPRVAHPSTPRPRRRCGAACPRGSGRRRR